MDAPLWTHDGLLVLEPYHTGFLGLAHHVAYLLTLGQIEIVISLDTATMGVRWHGVPYATLLQLGQTHLQLAGALLEGGIYTQLVDGTLVTLGLGAQRLLFCTNNHSLQTLYLTVLTTIECNPLRLIVLVGSSRVKIDLT